MDLHLPILYPGDVAQSLDLGRHAIALSRASGLWAGLKVVSSVADGTGSVVLDPQRVSPSIPTVDGEPYECRPDALLLGAHSMEIERELRGIRSDLAVAYGELASITAMAIEDDASDLADGNIRVRAIHAAFDVGVVDIKEFNCCGYPLRNIDFKAFILLAARNLAVAEQDAQGLSNVTLHPLLTAQQKHAPVRTAHRRRCAMETGCHTGPCPHAGIRERK